MSYRETQAALDTLSGGRFDGYWFPLQWPLDAKTLLRLAPIFNKRITIVHANNDAQLTMVRMLPTTPKPEPLHSGSLHDKAVPDLHHDPHDTDIRQKAN